MEKYYQFYYNYWYKYYLYNANENKKKYYFYNPPKQDYVQILANDRKVKHILAKARSHDKINKHFKNY